MKRNIEEPDTPHSPLASWHSQTPSFSFTLLKDPKIPSTLNVKNQIIGE